MGSLRSWQKTQKQSQSRACVWVLPARLLRGLPATAWLTGCCPTFAVVKATANSWPKQWHVD